MRGEDGDRANLASAEADLRISFLLVILKLGDFLINISCIGEGVLVVQTRDALGFNFH